MGVLSQEPEIAQIQQTGYAIPSGQRMLTQALSFTYVNAKIQK